MTSLSLLAQQWHIGTTMAQSSGTNRSTLLNLLNAYTEGLTIKKILKLTNMPRRTAYNTLADLKKAGFVTNLRPLWKIAEKISKVPKREIGIKRYLNALKRAGCIYCGYRKVVHIHHKDGDRNNNNRTNLVPLCPNHHAELHDHMSNMPDPLTPSFPVEPGKDRRNISLTNSNFLKNDGTNDGTIFREPTFPMENFMTENQEFIDEEISESAEEPSPDSMTIGAIAPLRILWRPNNYRRGLKLKKGFSLKGKSPYEVKRVLGSFPVETLNIGEHNRLIYLGMGQNIQIMIGKESLVGIWTQAKIGGHKETFLIEARDIEALDKRLDEKKKEIQERLDGVLIALARKLDARDILNEPYWIRHEDWVKGEEVIDSIPKETIIHDTVFKKVYGKGIEFVGGKGIEPNVRLKNYIKNRALESLLPEVRAEMADLRHHNLTLAKNFELHYGVLKDIDDSIKQFGRETAGMGAAFRKLLDRLR